MDPVKFIAEIYFKMLPVDTDILCEATISQVKLISISEKFNSFQHNNWDWYRSSDKAKFNVLPKEILKDLNFDAVAKFEFIIHMYSKDNVITMQSQGDVIFNGVEYDFAAGLIGKQSDFIEILSEIGLFDQFEEEKTILSDYQNQINGLLDIISNQI